MIRAGDMVLALSRRLGAASASPALDAELLVAHVLGVDRSALAARPELGLGQDQQEMLGLLMLRRLAGEPVAYLTGRKEFWSLGLAVTPAVLVPRPETELLVELALESLSGRASPSVLDLGTGSGAVAIAIARERPDAAVTATDASAAALTIAVGNAARLGIANVRFLRGSWFAPVAGARFDLVVSNPPYVADGDPALAALAHEPRAALVAGPSGLEALAAICKGAPAALRPRGMLVVEHGAGQAAAVRALMAQAGLARAATRLDLAGRERVTAGAMPPDALESGARPLE